MYVHGSTLYDINKMKIIHHPIDICICTYVSHQTNNIFVSYQTLLIDIITNGEDNVSV